MALGFKVLPLTLPASDDLSSADNLCKQFGLRSGPTQCRSWSRSKLFDSLIVFLKEFLKKVGRRQKNHKKIYPACKELRNLIAKLMKVWYILHRIWSDCMCSVLLARAFATCKHTFFITSPTRLRAIALIQGLSCPHMHTHKYFRS